MSILWLRRDPLILASRSSARRMLLENAGIPIEVKAANIDERSIEADLVKVHASPRQIAQVLSREKGLAIEEFGSGQLVLSCDQTMEIDGKIFSKPADRHEAEATLRLMAGRFHELHSAATLMRDRTIVTEILSSVRLKMRPLQDDFITHYLDTIGDVAFSSVGSYQIEGFGIHLFEAIEGDQFSIMGLPLLPVLKALRAEGCLKG